MNCVIEEKRQELERVCRRRGVRRIELFGSAARSTTPERAEAALSGGPGDGFDPDKSDLDFLVTFHELGFNQYADAYFGLLEDLQRLFQRPVDLVVASAIQNPFHEKAGRSQVGSFAFRLGKVFFSAESPLSPPFHPHSR